MEDIVQTVDGFSVCKRVYLENTIPPHNKYYDVIVCIDPVEKLYMIRALWGDRRKFSHDYILGLGAFTKCINADVTKIYAYFDELVKSKIKKSYKIVAEATPMSEDTLKDFAKERIKMSTKDLGSDEVIRHLKEMKSKAFSLDESKVEVKEKEVEKEVTLAVCKEERPYVPEKFWYCDVGYLKPVAFGIKNNLAVLLIGDTGSGKTTLIRYLAAVTKNAFRRVNLNGGTNADDFVGKWVIKGKEMIWEDGVLIEAMRKGYWLLIDELNAILPEIAFVLHSVLDDDKMAVLTSKDGEIVKAHPDFRLLASMNPDYAGTHRLNEALLDRFPIVVKCEFPKEKDEIEIVKKRTGLDNLGLIKKMVDVGRKARDSFRQDKIISPFSTRKIIDWAELTKQFTPAQAFVYAVLNKAEKEDVDVLKDIAGIVFPDEEFRNVLRLF